MLPVSVFELNETHLYVCGSGAFLSVFSKNSVIYFAWRVCTNAATKVKNKKYCFIAVKAGLKK